MFPLTLAELKTLATNIRVYQEGQRLHQADAIHSLLYLPGERILLARVEDDTNGPQLVQITLRSNLRPSRYQCTCEASRRFWGFCPHATAVLLKCIEENSLDSFQAGAAEAQALLSVYQQERKRYEEQSTADKAAEPTAAAGRDEAVSSSAEPAPASTGIGEGATAGSIDTLSTAASDGSGIRVEISTEEREKALQLIKISREAVHNRISPWDTDEAFRLPLPRLIEGMQQTIATQYIQRLAPLQERSHLGFGFTILLPRSYGAHTPPSPRIQLNFYAGGSVHRVTDWFACLQGRATKTGYPLSGSGQVWNHRLPVFPRGWENFWDELIWMLSGLYALHCRENITSSAELALPPLLFSRFLRLCCEETPEQLTWIWEEGRPEALPLQMGWPRLSFLVEEAGDKPPMYRLRLRGSHSLRALRSDLGLWLRENTVYWLPPELSPLSFFLLAASRWEEGQLLTIDQLQAIVRCIDSRLGSEVWEEPLPANLPPCPAPCTPVFSLDKDVLGGLTVGLSFFYEGRGRLAAEPLELLCDPAERSPEVEAAGVPLSYRDRGRELEIVAALLHNGFKRLNLSKTRARAHGEPSIPGEGRAASRIRESQYLLAGREGLRRFFEQVIPKLGENALYVMGSRLVNPVCVHLPTPIAAIDWTEGARSLRCRLQERLSPTDLAALEEARLQGRDCFLTAEGRLLYWSLPEDKDILDRWQQLLDWEPEAEDGNFLFPTFRALPLAKLIEDEDPELSPAFKRLREAATTPPPADCEELLPEDLRARLRPYQLTGIRWLQTLSHYGLGGILADDMGLGKTVQALSHLLLRKKQAEREGRSCPPALVITPKALLYNWRAECRRYTPELRCCVIRGTKAQRLEAYEKEGAEADIWILSYAQVRQDIAELEALNWSTLILDEAQSIKNHRARTTAAIKKLHAADRFALTGTPIENRLAELWSVFDFLMPGFLFRYTRFHKVYELPVTRDGDRSKLEQLRLLIRPFLLRRLKSEVLTELPPKLETVVPCPLLPEQQKLYHRFLGEARQTLLKLREEARARSPEAPRLSTQQTFTLLSLLTRLRQICCHPKLFLPEYTGDSGKLEVLEQLLDTALAGGHRALIFSQFTSLLAQVRELCERKEIEALYLDGQVSAQDRIDRVNRFNEGQGDVFLVSLHAGGTGLNLTGADTVFLLDPWWNPAVERQATDRAHRLGQTRTVQVYRLLAHGTIEDQIARLQEQKLALVDDVILSGENFLQRMTPDDLLALFSEEEREI